MRDGKQWPEGPDLAKKRKALFCAGPSRAASCDTARPARRAGQPQKKTSKNIHFLKEAIVMA
ncbi:hypothetical protein OP864_12370 [Saprospira grandis]|nr:hypothetical protein [Saprospira grandis]WBM76300.1 hypothetical protein OP864_12370 [Saprospira grandis]